MHSSYNMILNIDATQESFSLKKIPDPVLEKVLGGKGLALKMLLENNPPGLIPCLGKTI